MSMMENTLQHILLSDRSGQLQLFEINSNGLLISMYGHTYSKSKDQPGKVANPARGQLNRKNEYFPVPVHA